MEFKNIVIVGNTNVGKSLLFNKLCNGDFSLVYDKDNTTLDYISVYVNEKKITDTAGINKYAEWLNLYGSKVLDEADLILYVCDISQPITFELEDLFRKLHKLQKEIWIVVNKIDKKPHADFNLHKMNASQTFHIAAIEKRGVKELFKAMNFVYQEQDSTNEESKNIVAIVGRENAGKSTLMNYILSEQRVITSEIPGTTVDHIMAKKHLYGHDITFIDTPGFSNDKDSFMHKINKRRESLLNNDFIGQIVLIDAEIGLTRQDKQVIDQAQYNGLFTIICVNKYDMITLYVKEQLKHMNVAKNIQIFNISAIDGTGVKSMLSALTYSISNFHKFTTPKLNKFMTLLKQKEGMSRSIGQIKYMVQTSTHPITILYFAPHALSIYDMKCIKKYMFAYFDIKNYRILLQHKYTS